MNEALEILKRARACRPKAPARPAGDDLGQAIAAFKADHPILDVFERHDLKRTGKEYHGPCPLCGGTDRFTVWPHEGRAWCRQRCTPRGNALDWSMRLEGHDPNPRETARYLLAKGYLQPRGRPPERKPTPTPARDTAENVLGAINAPPLSEYETEWLEETAGKLLADSTLSYAPETAYAEAARRLKVIHAREGAARGRR